MRPRHATRRWSRQHPPAPVRTGAPDRPDSVPFQPSRAPGLGRPAPARHRSGGRESSARGRSGAKRSRQLPCGPGERRVSPCRAAPPPRWAGLGRPPSVNNNATSARAPPDARPRRSQGARFIDHQGEYRRPRPRMAGGDPATVPGYGEAVPDTGSCSSDASTVTVGSNGVIGPNKGPEIIVMKIVRRISPSPSSTGDQDHPITAKSGVDGQSGRWESAGRSLNRSGRPPESERST